MKMERLNINTAYRNLRTLRADPPVHRVASFLPLCVCAKLRGAAHPLLKPSAVQPLSVAERRASGIRTGGGRNSSTAHLHHRSIPSVLERAEDLLQLPRVHFEYPQVARYKPGQQYTSHLDAVDLASTAGARMADEGGQRICTLLIYLNTCTTGGETHFGHLDLAVAPQEGDALVFFPAFLCGTPDPRLQHSAQPAVDEKWVLQLWARQHALHLPHKVYPTERQLKGNGNRM